MTATYGPFDNEQQARNAAHAIIRPDDGCSILSEDQKRALLELACEAAGVELGDWDMRVVRQLANYEDYFAATVAGMITRAREAAKRSIMISEENK